MISVSENLKLRLVSSIILFSSVILLISLGGIFYTTSIIIISLFCAAEFFTIVAKAKLDEQDTKVWIYKGVLCILIPAVSLLIIRDVLPNGLVTSFWLLTLVSIVDIGAYFIGKSIGSHKLAPTTSPSKTIEGLIGGVLVSLIASIGFYYFFHSKLSLSIFIIISILLAVIAQISDFAESAFKRAFSVKDSSNLIPGHGGFLDRLDSYFLAAPALLVLVLLSKSIIGVSIF